MSRKEDNSFGFAMGILAGMVGGVVAGILFAPKSGEESRKELKEAIDELKEKYSPEIIQAKEQALSAIKSSKEKVEDAYKKFNDYLKARQLAKAKNNETNVDEM
ncbi:MAG: YtxH domain-containing protein [Candidatus Gastranaerophilales bacterium]|nr:YtxH domain-containing protein [Candidatus Gastranaerophilales bacterium]